MYSSEFSFKILFNLHIIDSLSRFVRQKFAQSISAPFNKALLRAKVLWIIETQLLKGTKGKQLSVVKFVVWLKLDRFIIL